MNWLDVLALTIATIAIYTSLTIHKSAFVWPHKVSHRELLKRMERVHLRLMCGNIILAIGLSVVTWRFGINGIVAYVIAYFVLSWLWQSR